jgi:hypothetical protein
MFVYICRKDLLGVFEELKSRAFKSGSEPLEPAVEHVQPLNKTRMLREREPMLHVKREKT